MTFFHKLIGFFNSWFKMWFVSFLYLFRRALARTLGTIWHLWCRDFQPVTIETRFNHTQTTFKKLIISVPEKHINYSKLHSPPPSPFKQDPPLFQFAISKTSPIPICANLEVLGGTRGNSIVFERLFWTKSVLNKGQKFWVKTLRWSSQNFCDISESLFSSHLCVFFCSLFKGLD